MSWYIIALVYFWTLVKLWFSTIFITPFVNMDMLWLLVPVWISWFFAEFFQEKLGTSMGNAISNAVVVLWGAIDCARQTLRQMANHAVVGFANIFLRFFIVFLIFSYGALIVILGWKGKRIIRVVGRVREVTYVFAMFTPIFYGSLPFSMNHLIATLMFFPVFYYIIEFICKITPNPKSISEDMNSPSA